MPNLPREGDMDDEKGTYVEVCAKALGDGVEFPLVHAKQVPSRPLE